MPTPPVFDEFYLTDSARRHGFDEDDVADVFLGRNRAGAYLLIVARVVEYQATVRWCVFHVNRMTDADKRLYRRHSIR